MPRRPLVVGNWKMNGLRASLKEIASVNVAYDLLLQERLDLVICPPATLILTAAEQHQHGAMLLGAQDCAATSNGAHTGDLSAVMLQDVGAAYVIVGHSERRADHGETDALVKAKALRALSASLIPIICVGETLAERERDKAFDIVGAQLSTSLPDDGQINFVVAYEPVWAIGTGMTPTANDISSMHAFIRRSIEERLGKAASQQIRILYGGSVKPENAQTLLNVDNVDGALVGGASLNISDFMEIAAVYR